MRKVMAKTIAKSLKNVGRDISEFQVPEFIKKPLPLDRDHGVTVEELMNQNMMKTV